MTGILEGDAVPNQLISALIAREPTGAGWIDELQLHPYAPGALYRLYAAPEWVSDIALQPSGGPGCDLGRPHRSPGRGRHDEWAPRRPPQALNRDR